MKRTATIAAVTGILAALAGCGGQSDPESSIKARIVVTPSSAMFYDSVSTVISGLPANTRVTVSASADGGSTGTWSSTAQFESDAAGVVSLSQPSVGGSYQGSDAMGLVEALAPSQLTSEYGEFFSPPGTGAFTIRLSAGVNGHVVGTGTMTRERGTVKPVTETPAATGVYGELFLPAHPTGPKPAVLVFGGSEGGIGRTVAEQGEALAAQGYPALVVAYFDEPGLTTGLENVPLEYFVKALNLLAKQPGVDRNHLLVWGTSRGSEAALLLGAHFPNLVHGVIAGVPSAVVWGSYPSRGDAAWTLGGNPVPSAPLRDWNDPDPADAQNAIIPVEQIRGPVFLVCGGQDQVWSSCPYTDAISARLARNHFPYPVTALHYPAAGHFGGDLIPFMPFADEDSPTATLSGSGGTELADEQAEAQSWPRLLAFLAQQ
ncbi:MAG TPA: acyl-CoA thioesterase/bile acid-CoA:amino acid N-acyltransferase family protein [Actinospica sp.]|nr:acyl-CoA thioesterase/bile acid-CoA:amino acid N-acyltransferase family protein [Actinospica sp.]